ncbi:MAG: hypothetical protein WBM04_14320, partial [Candidatus Korobacteraceae bacterium]
MLKIERADKHIADFKQRLLTSSDRYGPSFHMDGNTGEKFLYYGLDDRYLRSDLALITGDAIHNLRSALDIAWGEIVNTVGKPSTYTKFPISSTKPRNWLESVLAKGAGIDPTSRMFDFIVNHVKCYQGGDRDILALHDLDINDKHRLLIPMVAVTGITGVELENEDGSIDIFDIVLTRDNPYRLGVGLETKLKNHGEVRFWVTFGKGTPTESLQIIPTLEEFSGKVWKLIRQLERMK